MGTGKLGILAALFIVAGVGVLFFMGSDPADGTREATGAQVMAEAVAAAGPVTVFKSPT